MPPARLPPRSVLFIISVFAFPVALVVPGCRCEVECRCEMDGAACRPACDPSKGAGAEPDGAIPGGVDRPVDAWTGTDTARETAPEGDVDDDGAVTDAGSKAPDAQDGGDESADGLACPEGTACNPIPIPELPYQDARDGALGPGDDWDHYAPCGPEIDESGPEWIYALTLETPGVLHARLDEALESDAVDMDVHILAAPDPDACLARAHYHAAVYVEPGTYWIAVDTWVDGAGVGHPGPYALEVYLSQGSLLPEEAGFNKYVVQAINDGSLYPKDGTYPFCYQNPSCEPTWVDIYFGIIHDTGYLGETLFEGTQRCYCVGHTLEIFLDAYRRYQAAMGLGEDVPYGDLSVGDVDIGGFYQHWFGFGIAPTADSGAALEFAGIGTGLLPDEWELAVTGDFTNISRSNGTGHAVIFVDWIWEDGEIAGLRYYGCNGNGESHPDPEHPDNQTGVSGPSFVTEYLTTHGGLVIPEYVFIGRAFDPAGL